MNTMGDKIISKEFARDLTKLINVHSIDDTLDMPDYVIAEYVRQNLLSLKHLHYNVNQARYEKEHEGMVRDRKFTDDPTIYKQRGGDG